MFAMHYSSSPQIAYYSKSSNGLKTHPHLSPYTYSYFLAFHKGELWLVNILFPLFFVNVLVLKLGFIFCIGK
jgi:hypothetical protein